MRSVTVDNLKEKQNMVFKKTENLSCYTEKPSNTVMDHSIPLEIYPLKQQGFLVFYSRR